MSDVDIPDNETRISQPDAAKLLGGVSIMTIWRWRKNAELNFQGSIEINERHYYSRDKILAWRPPLKPPKPQPGRRQGNNAA